jgi:Mg2+ and Co2+ transporter CorA
MNDRIKELLKQAGVNYAVMPKDTVYEKLAELIVKECANRLREIDYELVILEDGMCDPSISDAMLIAASDIEEHFGVDQ